MITILHRNIPNILLPLLAKDFIDDKTNKSRGTHPMIDVELMQRRKRSPGNDRERSESQSKQVIFFKPDKNQFLLISVMNGDIPVIYFNMAINKSPDLGERILPSISRKN